MGPALAVSITINGQHVLSVVFQTWHDVFLTLVGGTAGWLVVSFIESFIKGVVQGFREQKQREEEGEATQHDHD